MIAFWQICFVLAWLMIDVSTVVILALTYELLWERRRNKHLRTLMVNTSRGRNELWKRSGY